MSTIEKIKDIVGASKIHDDLQHTYTCTVAEFKDNKLKHDLASKNLEKCSTTYLILDEDEKVQYVGSTTREVRHILKDHVYGRKTPLSHAIKDDWIILAFFFSEPSYTTCTRLIKSQFDPVYDKNCSQDSKKYMRNYYSLRRTVGIVGIALPVILALISFITQTDLMFTISKYYHHPIGFSHDVYISALTILGIFLFFYIGYDKTDNILANIAAILAFATAWFPSTPPSYLSNIMIWCNNTGAWCSTATIGKLHLLSAASLFICFIIFSGFRFTKSDVPKEAMTRRKRMRNKVYIWCASIMAALLLLIVCIFILIFFSKSGTGCFAASMEKISNGPVILILESFLLVAFGISWLVKGEGLLKDKERTENRSHTACACNE